MGRSSSIISSILLLISITPVSSQVKDNADRCECFRTNASAHYFTNHVFRDYRKAGSDAGAVPKIITDVNDSADALATSNYFLSDDWQDLWQTQSWNNSALMETNSASVLMVNSPNNVYLERSKDNDPSYSAYLTLRTLRLPEFQSAAEIATKDSNFHYLSLRLLARVIGSPGACAGIFTYLGDSTDPQKVQEADIEILTSGPRNVVQYTNQPSDSDSGHPIDRATRNASNPAGRDWTLWNTYRYDWTPEDSKWFVNGESVANISFQVPRDPTQVIFNMWSDGGLWTQNMSVYEQAYLQIQWVQMIYNTSGPADGGGGGSTKVKRDGVNADGLLPVRDLGNEKRAEKGCALVCSVDENVAAVGIPAFLYNDTGNGGGRGFGEGMSSGMAWIPLFLVGAAFWVGL